MDQRIRIDATIPTPEDADLAALDRIAAESGPLAEADIRALARVLAIVIRGSMATTSFLQRLGSAAILQGQTKR